MCSFIWIRKPLNFLVVLNSSMPRSYGTAFPTETITPKVSVWWDDFELRVERKLEKKSGSFFWDTCGIIFQQMPITSKNNRDAGDDHLVWTVSRQDMDRLVWFITGDWRLKADLDVKVSSFLVCSWRYPWRLVWSIWIQRGGKEPQIKRPWVSWLLPTVLNEHSLVCSDTFLLLKNGLNRIFAPIVL